MQKVILDTNVLVSALIQKNYPYFIVNELFLGSKIQLCVSGKLFLEYREVLNRDKFSKYPDIVTNVQVLLIEIFDNSLKFNPKIELDIIKICSTQTEI